MRDITEKTEHRTPSGAVLAKDALRPTLPRWRWGTEQEA